MSFISLTLLFWMILDPVGNVPLIVGLMSSFSPQRQTRIILREMLIALSIMLLACFFGSGFFDVLQVSPAALSITGGIMLSLIGINMVLARPQLNGEEGARQRPEPFIVPLAVPAIAGPGILAAIALYSRSDEIGLPFVIAALIVAWLLCFPIVLFAPWIKHCFGVNGATVVERLFGYLVVLVAVQMILGGCVDSLCLHAKFSPHL